MGPRMRQIPLHSTVTRVRYTVGVVDWADDDVHTVALRDNTSVRTSCIHCLAVVDQIRPTQDVDPLEICR